MGSTPTFAPVESPSRGHELLGAPRSTSARARQLAAFAVAEHTVGAPIQLEDGGRGSLMARERPERVAPAPDGDRLVAHLALQAH